MIEECPLQSGDNLHGNPLSNRTRTQDENLRVCGVPPPDQAARPDLAGDNLCQCAAGLKLATRSPAAGVSDGVHRSSRKYPDQTMPTPRRAIRAATRYSPLDRDQSRQRRPRSRRPGATRSRSFNTAVPLVDRRHDVFPGRQPRGRARCRHRQRNLGLHHSAGAGEQRPQRLDPRRRLLAGRRDDPAAHPGDGRHRACSRSTPRPASRRRLRQGRHDRRRRRLWRHRRPSPATSR